MADEENMKVKFVKSIFDIDYDEIQPIAKEEHRGKICRILNSKNEQSLLIVLPCGHLAHIDTWTVTGIETDTPSATPSIFCKGKEIDTTGKRGGDCWHGYLTNGELLEC